MKKEKAFQILSELAKNKYPMNNLGMEDYGYLMSEHEVECFSHTSLTNENVVRIKEVMDKLGKDLINLGKDYERFVMIIEYPYRIPPIIHSNLCGTSDQKLL